MIINKSTESSDKMQKIPVLDFGGQYNQLMAHVAGGMVEGAEDSSEYGKIEVYARNNILFTDIPSKSVCWMSHHDYIPHPPKGFTTIAITDKCPTAAMCDESRRLYGVQFHPEVTHTEYGKQILHNFLYDILGKVSNRIINEVDRVNRVVYDITSKPPGPVEWE